MLVAPLEDRFPHRCPWTPRRPMGSSSWAARSRATRAKRAVRRSSTRASGSFRPRFWRGDTRRRGSFSTGGNGSLSADHLTHRGREHQEALSLWRRPARVTLEDHPATPTRTHASGGFGSPRAGQRWLLVTSGFHMPRVDGPFREGRLRRRRLSGSLPNDSARGHPSLWSLTLRKTCERSKLPRRNGSACRSTGRRAGSTGFPWTADAEAPARAKLLKCPRVRGRAPHSLEGAPRR